MAQRHPALVLLSRDHHDALLLAIRLQQGTAALQRLWSHDRAVQARYVVEFHRQHLRKHFSAEEELLFPLVDLHIPTARALKERLVTDHRFFERTAEGLESPNASTLEQILTEYGRRLEEHIRLEDRELFPAVERSLTDDVLKKLQLDMEGRYAEDRTPIN